MSSLNISPLLNSIPISRKILEKISFPQLCRLRSTCKKVNEIAEQYRYYLANKKRWDMSENVLFVNYIIEQFDGEKIITNPAKELSCLHINAIIFDDEDEFSTEKQSELVQIFAQWRPKVERMEIKNESGFSSETIKGILWNSTYEFLTVNSRTVTIDELISLEPVQRTKVLTLHTQNGGLPEEEVLERLKKVNTVSFLSENGFGWRAYVINTAIPQLMQESNLLEEDDPSPRIIFRSDRPINAESAFPNMHLIYFLIRRRPHLLLHNFSFKTFAIALQRRICILIDYTIEERQQLTILFIKKDKNSLKKTLEKETPDKISARLLEHIFKKIVGEQ